MADTPVPNPQLKQLWKKCASFHGVLGPSNFTSEVQKKTLGNSILACETETVAMLGENQLEAVEFMNRLMDAGGDAVPVMLSHQAYPPQTLQVYMLNMLVHVHPVLVQHPNTQALLKMLTETTTDVCLIALCCHGSPVRLRESLFGLGSRCVVLRNMAKFIAAVTTVFRKGFVHGAVHEDSVVVTARPRLCLANWRLFNVTPHAACDLVLDAYCARDFARGQHPVLWMLWLCWLLHIRTQGGRPAAPYTLKGAIFALLSSFEGFFPERYQHEAQWAFCLRQCFVPYMHPSEAPWLECLLYQLEEITNYGMLGALDMQWTHVWKRFQEEVPYADAAYASELVRIAQSAPPGCVRSFACAEPQARHHAQAMLVYFLPRLAQDGVWQDGDVFMQMCYLTDTYFLCQHLWFGLCAADNTLCGGSLQYAFSNIYKAQIDSMHKLTLALVDALDAASNNPGVF